MIFRTRKEAPMFRIALVTIAALSVLAATAAAETIYLNEGDTIEGEILDVRPDSVVIALDGTDDAWVEIQKSQISPYGIFVIRKARIDADSREERIALADWAAEAGLCCIAREEYRDIVDRSGENVSEALEEKLDHARNVCAKEKIARARRLLKLGKTEHSGSILKEAIEIASRPELGAEAYDLLKVVEKRQAEEKAAKEARSKREAKEEKLEKIDTWMESVRALTLQADGLRRLGYLESGDLAEAEDDFQSAIAALTKARKVLRRVEKMPLADQRESGIREARNGIRERLSEVYVDLGHNYIVKGNLIKANECMGRALALDPNDPKALALREAIAIATAADDVDGRSSLR
jgi:tetratricopeptide (TPR) repeat protein